MRPTGRLQALLGIDLGTSEAKAALVGTDGRLLGLGRAGYPTDMGTDGRAEQDPRDWWSALGAAVAGALREASGAGQPRANPAGSSPPSSLPSPRPSPSPGGWTVEVAGLCVVGQGPTLVVVDADGMPVRPALTWQDRRAGAGGYGLLPRMAWLAREDPDGTARARWLMASWDAAGLWLSGEAASSMQAHERPPSPTDLAAAGVPERLVPPARPFGTRLGSLRPGPAAALGLPAGIPVIAGVNDGTASMLGAGLRSPGDAVDTGGTSGGIGIYADRPVHLPGVFLAPAPLPARWVVGGAMAALGSSVDWLRTAILGGRWTADELFEAAAGVAPGSGGLVFLPYLAGERAPVFDEEARGAFFGLTLAHDAAHLARAVLEATAFAMRHVAEPIVAAGAPLTELRVAGRPVPGDTWARIKADVLGVPAAIPTVGETAVVGAAVLAAVGVGVAPDLEGAVGSMTGVARRLEPDPAAHARYSEAFGVYRSLYPALRSLREGAPAGARAPGSEREPNPG